MTEFAHSRNLLIDRIENVARRAGDRPTLVEGERRLTHAAVSDLGARTETEAAVARVWSDVLGVDRVGAHSTFIELGGDSVTAMLVVNGLEAHFGARITLAQILTAASTVAGVASVVNEQTRR